jgi:hypothetical protein
MENKINGTNNVQAAVGAKRSAFDISKLQSFRSKTGIGAGVITIVYSEANGKRIKLSKGLMEELGNPQKVQFAFFDGLLAISSDLPGNNSYISLAKGGIVYSAALIHEIVNEFDLDYSERVSITFQDVEYEENDGAPIALIEMSN